jgi:hypothetical protein
VALDLVLLKLVQMRRLVPFAEIVARVERMLGGAAPEAAALPAARPAPGPRPAAALPLAAGPAAAAPHRPNPRPEPADPAVPPAPPPHPSPSGSPEALLATMIAHCQGRPSLAAPLRAAAARLDGGTLEIEVPPDFMAFGTMHADEYRDLARKAAGKPLAVRIVGGTAAVAAPAPSAPEEDRRQQLREEAQKEKAVQEALDLFDGRVLDVREAKPSREDA